MPDLIPSPWTIVGADKAFELKALAEAGSYYGTPIRQLNRDCLLVLVGSLIEQLAEHKPVHFRSGVEPCLPTLTIDPPSALDAELATYERTKERLLREAEGRFVAICGDRVLLSRPTWESALESGYAMFGLKPFLVRQILREQPTHFIGSGIPAGRPD